MSKKKRKKAVQQVEPTLEVEEEEEDFEELDLEDLDDVDLEEGDEDKDFEEEVKKESTKKKGEGKSEDKKQSEPKKEPKKKKEPSTEGMVTTKEVSEIVGVAPRSLRNTLRKKFYTDPESRGNSYVWDPDDEVLQEIYEHYEVKKKDIDAVYKEADIKRNKKK